MVQMFEHDIGRGALVAHVILLFYIQSMVSDL